ncbi:MAG TPA: hypothetical protein DDW73_04895 [Rhizobium sp.]|jgi:hypothetical protein|nr:hypothetical protein [Rhizobium sp.]
MRGFGTARSAPGLVFARQCASAALQCASVALRVSAWFVSVCVQAQGYFFAQAQRLLFALQRKDRMKK